MNNKSTLERVGLAMAEYSNGNGSPWWVKLFVQVGFPTALAIVLIAALLGWLPTPIMQTLSRLEYNAWQQTMINRAICYALVERKETCEPWKPRE